MKTKLFALNFAIFLCITCALPVAAAFIPTGGHENYEINASYRVEEDKLAVKEATAEQNDADGPMANEKTPGVRLLAARPQSYYIWVGNTSFSSDEDQQGSGWTYLADGNALYLNGYSGAGIRASGDLAIYAEGVNRINGSDGTNYGSNGISVTGNLDMSVYSGTTYVNAGKGKMQGGDGIAAKALFIYSATNATLAACGGNATGTATMGGDGLYGSSVFLYGRGRVNTTGGNATAANSLGGSGILAKDVYIDALCAVNGGKGGAYGGAGIYFGNTCEIGAVNATITGGAGAYGYALQNSDGLSWHKNRHTTVSGTEYKVIITVRKYTLDLLGNGGKRGSAQKVSLKEYYGKEYALSEYLFQRKGYTQVGWTTTAGSLVPLNETYMPEESTKLTAEWIASSTDDIILNALSGKFSDGDRYKKYNAQAVAPASMQFNRCNLLGWSTSLNITENPTTGVLDGVWYSGDSVIESAGAPISIFAHADRGSYIVYHPTAGSVKKGGTMLVQGTKATHTDLQVYALNDSYVQAPEKYTFAGWSTQKNSNVVECEGDAPLDLESGDVLHLYAVWAPRTYAKALDEGLSVSATPLLKKLEIAISDAWLQNKSAGSIIAAVYEGDRLLYTKFYKSQDKNRIELQYPGNESATIKLFVWKKNLAPLCKAYDFGSVKDLIRE